MFSGKQTELIHHFDSTFYNFIILLEEIIG